MWLRSESHQCTRPGHLRCSPGTDFGHARPNSKLPLCDLNSRMEAGDTGLNVCHRSADPSSPSKTHQNSAKTFHPPWSDRVGRAAEGDGPWDAEIAIIPGFTQSPREKQTLASPQLPPQLQNHRSLHTHTTQRCAWTTTALLQPPPPPPPPPWWTVTGAVAERLGVNHTTREAPAAFVETRILSL